MRIVYSRAVIRKLAEDAGDIRLSMNRIRDRETGDFGRCRETYNRLSGEIQEAIRKACSALESAESDYRSAQADYSSAMNAADTEDESARSAALERARKARERMAIAQQEARKAREKLSRQQAKMQKLSAIWEQHGREAEALCRSLEDTYAACATLVQTCTGDLQTYEQLMERSRDALHGQQISPGIATPGEAHPIGWCSRSSLTAVTLGANGGKTFSMSFGGITKTFPCTAAGAAGAYEAAAATGDPELISRAYAVFELETLREDLELTRGEAGFAQLGGYHRDVKNQDPAGYESHHIPARSVQDVPADWLPTISITREDHSKTSSYRGKQNHGYISPLSPSEPCLRYKDNVSQHIAKGSSGYIEALRNELYDLRLCTGHRYDGGISACLDAVIDMVITRGVPKSK